MASDNRTKFIKIRVNENELSEIKKRCTDKQLAKWIRNLCLGQKTKSNKKTPTADPALLRQLSGIGNNINQITRGLNELRLKARMNNINTIKFLIVLNNMEKELSNISQCLQFLLSNQNDSQNQQQR
jgi:hypothetical protein